MSRKSASHGCDRAVFPFSVALSSSSSTSSTALQEATGVAFEDDLARLCLPLKQDERVRVLQRDRQHSVDTSPALSQWCIAQREDGAVGLVPIPLLHRDPGPAFTLRTATSTAESNGQQPLEASSLASVSHRDPAQDLSSSSTPHVHQPPAQKPTALGTSGDSDDDAVDDAFQLQRRRQTSLRERVQALQSPCLHTDGLGPKPRPESPAASSTCDTLRVRPVPSTTGGAPSNAKRNEDAEVDAEQARLAEEVAHMSAELNWLHRDVVPCLGYACRAAQKALMAAEQYGSVKRKEIANAFDDDDDDVSAAEQHLARQLEAAQHLMTWLERTATRDSDNESTEDEDAAPDAHNVKTPSSKIAFLASRDLNRPPAKHSLRCTDGGTQGEQHDSYHIDPLRRLVNEESETIRCYRGQQQQLQNRLASLAQLTLELKAEEAALTTSETALKIVLATQTSGCADPSSDAWPRSLPGLTDDENTALSLSVATCEKYSRKLQALESAPGSGPISSLDMSDVKSDVVNARGAATDTDHSCLSSSPSTPENKKCTSRITDASASREVVEHLQQVLENGDRECAQLQTKLKALQDFCAAYGATAHQIEVQLHRGRHILSEKRKFLAQLHGASTA